MELKASSCIDQNWRVKRRKKGGQQQQTQCFYYDNFEKFISTIKILLSCINLILYELFTKPIVIIFFTKNYTISWSGLGSKLFRFTFPILHLWS